MQNQTKLTQFVSAGFVAIVASLLLLLFFWNRNNVVNDEHVVFVVGENGEVRLLTETLQHIETTRAMLYRAALTDAVGSGDDPSVVLKALHQQFDAMSEMVTQGSFDAEEKALWLNIHPLLHRYDEATEQVVDLLRQGLRQQAIDEIATTIDPTQKALHDAIDTLVQLQTNQISSDLIEAKENAGQNDWIFWALIGSVLIIAAIMRVVIKRVADAEGQQRVQGESIRALFEISATPGMSVDEQIDATLQLGAKLFSLPIGKVSKITAAENRNDAVYLVAPEQARQSISFSRPLSETFCSIVHANEKPLAVSHIGATELRHHPSYAKTKLETYIAAPVFVNNIKYGTVAFAGMSPRAKPFSSADMDFMTLIGKWISASIERKEALELASEKQTAVAANRAKSVFLAHMSHEIRTPLTAIIGFAETALDLAQSEQERKEALTTIIRSGRILLQIINDILDLSKIEAGKLEIEHVAMSLFDVVGDVKVIVEPKAREKGLAFHVNYQLPLPTSIEGDPVRLKQILLNLASNAIKFTKQGHVKLDVSYQAEQKQLSIDVVDSGIGLTKEQQQKLFQSFVQADSSTTRKYGGTGLGLSLSRQLATMLGGTINLVSEPNLGSKFSLWLPVATSEKDTWITTERDIPQSTPDAVTVVPAATLTGNVLLVEDTPENQKLISIMLSRLGVHVQLANNGQEALNIMSVPDHNIDLVLMDMQMPVMDGYTAVRFLREQNCKTPIVALTANAMHEDVRRVLDIGADDHLAKPIDRAVFYRTVARYLEGAAGHSTQEDYLESLLLAEDPELAELVTRFVNRLPELVENIKALSAKQDWAQLGGQIHVLKGLGGNFGYPRVSEIATEIELLLRSQTYKEIAPMVAALESTGAKIMRGMPNAST